MRRRRLLVPILLSLLVPLVTPTRVVAQMLDVQPGARIRVAAPGLVAGRVDGTVILRTADSVVIATPALAQYRFAFSSLSSLEVYQGRSRTIGAIKGALWTDAFMVPLALVSIQESPSEFNRAGMLAFAAMVYGGTGAIVGAIIGSDTWKSHVLSPCLGVGTDHLKLGVGLRF